MVKLNVYKMYHKIGALGVRQIYSPVQQSHRNDDYKCHYKSEIVSVSNNGLLKVNTQGIDVLKDPRLLTWFARDRGCIKFHKS